MGRTVLLIDITRCNGCYNCQLSCKDEHVGNDWSPIAVPQPNTGHFWYKITETVQGTVPKVRVHYMHEMCQHCEKCPIVEKGDPAVYRREDGLVIIDPVKAYGRRDLLDECPYGSIYWNPTAQIPQKCTGCAHLLDDGWDEPRCVQSCPVDVYTYGDIDSEEVQAKLATGEFEQLHPEYGTNPRIWYKGLLNKFFVAGDVYDPEIDECLEGATVTLMQGGKELRTLTTDVFGDFWFERCEPGVYDVKIEMPGYETKVVEGVDASEKDINIGGIELIKK